MGTPEWGKRLHPSENRSEDTGHMLPESLMQSGEVANLSTSKQVSP